MPEMTLSEAAKWAAVSRPTIHKALVSGRLSGRKDDNGQWRIDPAELERVYAAGKPVNKESNVSLYSPDIAEVTAAKDREIALLRELASKADATAADLRAERDRLLGIVEATSRLLTHAQQEAPGMALQAPRPAPALVLPRARAWLRLQLARL